MKEQIILDKEDIQKIIAKEFSVSPDNVLVSIVENCYGYGAGEHYENEVEVTIIRKSVELPSCVLDEEASNALMDIILKEGDEK